MTGLFDKTLSFIHFLRKMVLILFALVFFYASINPAFPLSTHGLSAEYRLFHHLFTNYSSYVRPKRHPNETIQVSITFALMQINSLNDKEQVLTTTGYMYVNWVDEMLQWEPKHFGNINKLVMMPEMIWLPDIGLDNTAENIYDTNHRKEYRVIIRPNGAVLWAPAGKFATSCNLDITYYPYDHQKCQLVFTNWIYPGTLVNLTISSDEVDMSDYAISGEWEVKGTKAIRGDRMYADPYPFVEFTLFLQRKYKYHIINILMPCVLLSALMLLVFWLPPDSGEKVSLGITVLLSFTVFLLMIAEQLPKTSDSLPVVGFYLMSVILISSSSIAITVVVLNLHHANPEHPISNRGRNVVFGVLARVAQYHVKSDAKTEALIQWRKSIHPVDGNDASAFQRLCDSPRANRDSPVVCKQPIENQILGNLERIIKESKHSEKQEIIAEEWKMVATIVDRFFFRVYLLLTVSLNLFIMVIIPVAQSYSTIEE